MLDRDWQAGRYRLGLAAAVILLCAGYVWLLVRSAETRKPWNDEAMSASAAYTLSTKGYLGTPIFDEKSTGFTHIGRLTYYILPLQMCFLAIWDKIAGWSLVSMRVLSMLWTAALLYAVYRMMLRLAGSRNTALLAAGLTALDYQMMSAASFGRYDTMLAALGFGAYAIYLNLREINLNLSLLLSAGCLSLACVTHPNALVYLLGFAFLVIRLDWRRVGWKPLLAILIPFGIVAAAMGVYILQDPQAFHDQITANSGHRLGVFAPLTAIRREIELRYLTAYGLLGHSAGHSLGLVRLKALTLVAYLVGLVGCLATREIRSRPGYRTILWLTCIHCAFFTLYENMKFNYYLVHLIPLYWCLFAAFANYLATRRRAWIPVLAVGLALVLAIQVGGLVVRSRLNEMGTSFLPAAEFVNQHAEPDDLVMGSCSLWFGLGPQRRLLDDNALGYSTRQNPRFIVVEEIYQDSFDQYRATRPDIYQHILKTLSQYDLVYDRNFYRIYQQRDLAARASK